MSEMFELSQSDKAQLTKIESETSRVAESQPAAPTAPAAPATPAAPAVPATAPEEHVEGTQEIGGKKMVPLSVLLEERGRRKEVESHFQTADKRLQTIIERFGAPQAVQPQPQPKDDGKFKPTVTYEQDPLEYLKQQNAWLANQVEKTSETAAKTNEQIQQEREFNALRTTYLTGHEQAIQQAPAYREAYNHLFGTRVNTFMAMGATQEQAIAAVRNEELNLAGVALKAGVNPQERILQLAKAHGWTGPSASNGAASGASGQGNAIPMDTLKRGLESARSLSDVGGAPGGGIDIAALANMSDEEFSRRTSGGNWEAFMKTG